MASFLKSYSHENKDVLIIDKGRNPEERSVIVIKNGVFKGFGFYTLNHQIRDPEILQSIIRPMKDDRDTQHIIQGYLRKNKNLKLYIFIMIYK